MRSTDEQLRLVRSRASKLRLKREGMLRRGLSAGCLLLALTLGLILPWTGGGEVTVDGAFFGSAVHFSPVAGYIVVAVLAFALGTCVTLLCVHRRERAESPEEEER